MSAENTERLGGVIIKKIGPGADPLISNFNREVVKQVKTPREQLVLK